MTRARLPCLLALMWGCQPGAPIDETDPAPLETAGTPIDITHSGPSEHTVHTGRTGGEAHTGDGPAEHTGAEHTGEPQARRTDWPQPNLDLASTRAALGAQICSDTVDQLDVAWSYATINGAGLSTNPIVVDGVVYLQTMMSDVVALDLDTGAQRWRRRSGEPTIGPNGVAVDGDLVFAPLDPLTFGALDRLSGEVVWTRDLRRHAKEGIDIQPIVHDGKVYVATVPMVPDVAHAPGTVGVLYALNARNGKTLWSFDTVDDPDTLWGNPDVNSGGGAWYPPAIDPVGERMFWGIANPAPFPGTPAFPNGSSRPGNNLYTNSLVALSTRTGELLWYDQVTPHDLFDFDFQLSPIRVDLDVDGVVQPLIIGAGKAGMVIAWNADTGARLWEATLGRHEHDTLTEVPADERLFVYPGIYGALETPFAYADGVLFLPVTNLGTWYTSTGKTWPNGDDIAQGNGGLAAIDARTGETLWNTPLGLLTYSGATVSCDLVFTATVNGTIFALDRATGEVRWTWTGSTGSNGWPAVVDDTLLFPMGMQSGQGAPSLVALRLGGAGR